MNGLLLLDARRSICITQNKGKPRHLSIPLFKKIQRHDTMHDNAFSINIETLFFSKQFGRSKSIYIYIYLYLRHAPCSLLHLYPSLFSMPFAFYAHSHPLGNSLARSPSNKRKVDLCITHQPVPLYHTYMLCMHYTHKHDFISGTVSGTTSTTKNPLVQVLQHGHLLLR